MKKHLLYFLMGAIVIAACQHKDENFRYSTKDNIYFGKAGYVGLTAEQIKFRYSHSGVPDPKKVLYSFAIDQKSVDTIFMPVTISGTRVSRDRKFKVSVTSDSTTAESPLHYAPLAEFYIIPADSGSAVVPIILYNKDTRLSDSTFYLKLELTPTEDFDASVPNYKYAKIGFSNRLERPVWWKQWESSLDTYSRTKHALYLISLEGVANKDLPPDTEGENGMLIPYVLFVFGKFSALLVDPFVWIKDHPNYALIEQGDDVYVFYNIHNEFVKYTLQLNEQDGKYYFIDEDGKYVTTNL